MTPSVVTPQLSWMWPKQWYCGLTRLCSSSSRSAQRRHPLGGSRRRSAPRARPATLVSPPMRPLGRSSSARRAQGRAWASRRCVPAGCLLCALSVSPTKQQSLLRFVGLCADCGISGRTVYRALLLEAHQVRHSNLHTRCHLATPRIPNGEVRSSTKISPAWANGEDHWTVGKTTDHQESLRTLTCFAATPELFALDAQPSSHGLTDRLSYCTHCILYCAREV